MVFDINRKTRIRLKWFKPKELKKRIWWLAYVGRLTDNVAKKQFFCCILLGLVFQVERPYHKSFSYKNMPKIKGRRKV